MTTKGFLPRSALATLAVRRAYDSLDEMQRGDVDLVCAKLSHELKKRSRSAHVGPELSLEVVGKLGIFLAREGS